MNEARRSTPSRIREGVRALKARRICRSPPPSGWKYAIGPATSLPLPRVCWLVEGFGGNGVLCSLAVPAALANRLRSPAGKALLHECRDPEEELPALATAVRRLL